MQLGVYEWCWTSDFNPSDVEHCQLASLLEESTGIGHREPTERLLPAALKALGRSHFQVVEWEDLAKFNSKTSCVPWYEPLEHMIQSPQLEWPLTFGDLPKESAGILLYAGVYNVRIFEIRLNGLTEEIALHPNGNDNFPTP